MTKVHNSLGFEVLPESVRERLFPNTDRPYLLPQSETLVRQHYEQFNIALPVTTPEQPDFEWILPKLRGSTMLRHAETVAKDFASEYDRRARDLIAAGLPPMPTATCKNAGWTRYVAGQEPESVEHPLENCLVFDCETLVVRGNFPIIFTAASSEAFYIWLHPDLCKQYYAVQRGEVLPIRYTNMLVPFGDNKLLIGHNSSFDFQRTVESHWLDVPHGKKRNYCIDTMSMHIACNGFSGPQRWVTRMPEGSVLPPWAAAGCGNSLVSCYNFHCWPEKPLGADSKVLREMFVVNDLDVIAASLDDLLQYALLDIVYTAELHRCLFLKYRQRRPSFIAFAGALHQSAHCMPLVSDWHEWIGRVEDKFEEYEQLIDKAGRDIADSLYKEFAMLGISPVLVNATVMYNLLQNAKESSASDYIKTVGWANAEGRKLLDLPAKWQMLEEQSWHSIAEDMHMSQLTTDQRHGINKLLSCPWTGLSSFNWTIKLKARKGKGLPEWYRGLGGLRRASKQLHQLCKISYQGHPIRPEGRKWVYDDESGVKHTVDRAGALEGDCGSVLFTKDYQDEFNEDGLVLNAPGSERVLELALAVTFWVTARSRVMSEIVDSKGVYTVQGETRECNVTSPSLLYHGTVSCRGVAPLWLTVPDCKQKHRHKLGAETKSRVQAPPGKTIIQGDFSAQELRILEVYSNSIGAKLDIDSDEQPGYVGSTVMSYGLCAGTKELGTDSHTMLARFAGITRDGAKTVAYGIAYGAGVPTVTSTIYGDMRYSGLQPTLKFCEEKAEEVVLYRKGKRNKHSGIYYGGTDSAAFTVLGRLASQEQPRTKLLSNMLTEPLCPKRCGNDFVTGRANWGVQSCARDMADLLMVLYNYLCELHGINSRVIFILHDEFVCIADEADEDICAWLFNVAHIQTWAALHETCGIYDMSTTGIFFEDVFSQKCLRKAHNLTTRTPSNPDEAIEDGKVYYVNDMVAINLQVASKYPEIYC